MHGVDADEPYINFHRPGLFAQTITDKKGKTRKRRLSAAGHHAGDLARNRHRDVGQPHTVWLSQTRQQLFPYINKRSRKAA